MAVVQVESGIPKKVSSFKPPHLDKIVFIMRLTGVAHNSQPLRNFKQLAMLLYNMFVICLQAVKLIKSVIFVATLNRKLKYFHYYLETIEYFIFIPFLIYLIIRLIFLSRKNLLSSLAKPDLWQHLEDYEEQRTGLCKKMVYTIWFVFITLSILYESFFDAFRAKGGVDNCENAPDWPNTTITNTKSYCYTSLILTFLTLPSLLGIAMVPIYVVLWITYCQRLFQGVNNELRKLNLPIDIGALQQCREQYIVLCGLIDDINHNYGILIAYYLFSVTFTMFTNGYAIIKSLLSDYEFEAQNVIAILPLFIGCVFLFFHSSSLKSEVSFFFMNSLLKFCGQRNYLHAPTFPLNFPCSNL